MLRAKDLDLVASVQRVVLLIVLDEALRDGFGFWKNSENKSIILIVLDDALRAYFRSYKEGDTGS